MPNAIAQLDLCALGSGHAFSLISELLKLQQESFSTKSAHNGPS
jgi:hypothetical protein